MILKEVEYYQGTKGEKIADYEEIPQEELWEDRELSNVEVQAKIINHVMQKGDWYLIRKVDDERIGNPL